MEIYKQFNNVFQFFIPKELKHNKMRKYLNEFCK